VNLSFSLTLSSKPRHAIKKISDFALVLLIRTRRTSPVPPALRGPASTVWNCPRSSFPTGEMASCQWQKFELRGDMKELALTPHLWLLLPRVTVSPLSLSGHQESVGWHYRSQVKLLGNWTRHAVYGEQTIKVYRRCKRHPGYVPNISSLILTGSHPYVTSPCTAANHGERGVQQLKADSHNISVRRILSGCTSTGKHKYEGASSCFTSTIHSYLSPRSCPSLTLFFRTHPMTDLPFVSYLRIIRISFLSQV